MKRMTVVLMALLAMTISELSAQTVTEYTRETPPDYKPSNTRLGNYPCSYFTPRIEWGRPLATGKLNLLVFLTVSAARESVELASRLDAKVDIVTSVYAYHFKWRGLKDVNGWWQEGPRAANFYSEIQSKQALDERAMVFLSPAYKHNAIIIGKLNWTVIPEDIRARILEKVKGGAALIFVSPWDVDAGVQASMQLGDGTNSLAENIKATIPLAHLPLDMDLEPSVNYPAKHIGPFEIRTGKLGEGNVVFLEYHDEGVAAKRDLGLTPFIKPLVGDDDLLYNYYYSILSKAIIHATGRKSGVSVRPDTVDATVMRDKLPAAPVTFNISSTNRILPGTIIYYEIRDRLNKVVAKGEEEIKQKDGEIAFTPRFPVLKQGLYMADAWIKRRGMVLDWASAAVTVTDKNYLESIATDKEYFGRDEGISGSITLKEPVPSGHKVVVELWDTYDRLEQRVELKGGDIKFSFAKIQYPLSRAYRIVGQVKSGDFVLDERETWTGLPSNDFDEFQFLVWGGVGTSAKINQTHMTLFKEYGLTGYVEDIHSKGLPQMVTNSADLLARNNLKAFPFTGLAEFFRLVVDEKVGTLPEGKWKESILQRYRPYISAFKRYGTIAYNLDSEGGILEDEAKWDNPTALKDYRLYLKGRYGDINGLNKIWGSAFNSFDDIGFVSFIEVKQGRQASRWLEQNLYKRDRFNSIVEYTVDLVRKLDPGARVGVDIMEASYDVPRMTKIMDAFIQAPLEYFDKEKDKARVNAGNFIGYYQGCLSEWHMRTPPWESLFRGGNALCWWPITYNVTKDLTEPLLCFKRASEEIHDIHSGYDRLLMSSDKRIDPILIFWSHNSEIAGVYNPLETSWAGARDNFINMLRRTGLDFQCVGEDFVEEKLQFGAKQRVLILPASQSISRKAVEKIKAFVNAGGLVIADYLPAVMDEYLRPYGGEEPKAAAVATKSETCPKCNGKKIINLGGAGDPLGNCPKCGGTGVVIKGGDLVLTKSALDEVFNFAEKGIRKYGKGHGLFLAGAPARDEWRALRAMLIAKGGVKGDIEVLDILGNTRTDLRTYVFDSGPAMFVGVLPDKTIADPPGEEFIVKLDRKLHVYDVRLHSYLGYTNAVTAGILPAQAKLLALLPARIDGLVVESVKKDYRPGEVITLEINILPDTLKEVALAVRVEVLKDGKIIPAYTKKLAVKGTASHAIPLALNQEKAEYILRVTEIISGHRQEMKIAVR